MDAKATCPLDVERLIVGLKDTTAERVWLTSLCWMEGFLANFTSLNDRSNAQKQGGSASSGR
jgi:hypothetical protein